MSTWTPEEIEARLTEVMGADADDERAQTRLRIMDVASEHFVRFGFRRASIGDIATDAGIGKGTLYLYFKSKKTLLLACAAREKLVIVPRVAALMQLPEAERFEAYVRVVLRYLFEAPLALALLRGDRELTSILKSIESEATADDRERSLGFVIDLLQPITPGLSDAQRREYAQLVSTVLRAAAHVEEGPGNLGILSIDDFVELYAGLLVAGVKAIGAK